jgi:hypothetical protein
LTTGLILLFGGLTAGEGTTVAEGFLCLDLFVTMLGLFFLVGITLSSSWPPLLLSGARFLFEVLTKLGGSIVSDGSRTAALAFSIAILQVRGRLILGAGLTSDFGMDDRDFLLGGSSLGLNG